MEEGKLLRKELVVRSLEPVDAPALLALLRRQPTNYIRFFTPFAFDETALVEVLRQRKKDVYAGLYWIDQLSGLFTLRGWDEGYDAPAFGVIIDQRFRGFGFEMVSLEAARVITKLRGAREMITKVHPTNMTAKGVARKTGFVLSETEPHTGNLIYRFKLDPRP